MKKEPFSGWFLDSGFSFRARMNTCRTTAICEPVPHALPEAEKQVMIGSVGSR